MVRDQFVHDVEAEAEGVVIVEANRTPTDHTRRRVGDGDFCDLTHGKTRKFAVTVVAAVHIGELGTTVIYGDEVVTVALFSHYESVAKIFDAFVAVSHPCPISSFQSAEQSVGVVAHEASRGPCLCTAQPTP